MNKWQNECMPGAIQETVKIWYMHYLFIHLFFCYEHLSGAHNEPSTMLANEEDKKNRTSQGT